MLASVVLHKFPPEVWDGMDFEDLRPVLRAFGRIHGAEDESAKPGAQEKLTDYDRALIAEYKREQAEREVAERNKK